jgi:hypothetical protein
MPGSLMLFSSDSGEGSDGGEIADVSCEACVGFGEGRVVNVDEAVVKALEVDIVDCDISAVSEDAVAIVCSMVLGVKGVAIVCNVEAARTQIARESSFELSQQGRELKRGQTWRRLLACETHFLRRSRAEFIYSAS